MRRRTGGAGSRSRSRGTDREREPDLGPDRASDRHHDHDHGRDHEHANDHERDHDHGHDRAQAHAHAHDRERLLLLLGRALRERREAAGFTLAGLARRAGMSRRFLWEVERGRGNVSVARLAALAGAVGTTASDLLRAGERDATRPVIALVGLRGAGKSTVGAACAARLGVPFVELDALVEREAGMGLAAVFEMHGEPYYRRLEREALRDLLVRFAAGAEGAPGAGRIAAVVATGGSVVTDEASMSLLRGHATTVWLRATAEEHMRRVVAQGDARPMRGRADAMAELRALYRARAVLYGRADRVVETTGRPVADVVVEVCALAGATSAATRGPKALAAGS